MDKLVILDHTMSRLFDLDVKDIIKPCMIEDQTTGENMLEFSYPLFDPDYKIEGGHIILIPDIDGRLQPYQVKDTGLSAYEDHIYKVTGEHLYYELGDGPAKSYNRVNDIAQIALAHALEDTRWKIGEIDPAITDLKSYSGTYQNPLEILRQVEKEYDCRLRFRAELHPTCIEGLYVDMELVDTVFSGQRFEFGRNLKGIDINVDYEQVKTALIGVSIGATSDPVTGEPLDLTFENAEWKTANGDPVNKPLGQNWVGDEAARGLYGLYDPDTGIMEHRFGLYDKGAAQTAEGLLQATWEVGQRKHFSPKVNIEAEVADLSTVKLVDVRTGEPVKLDREKIRLGNICYVIATGEGLLAALDVRIVRIERHLKEPGKTVVIFGDKFFSSSDYFRELEMEIDAKTRAAYQADRGPGATVTIASQETSAYSQYADIVVPTGQTLDTYFAIAMNRISEDYGGHILILEGTYLYDNGLVVNKNNLTISGQGEGTIIKLADNRTAATNGLYAVGVDGLQIRDIVFEGNKDNQESYETH